MKAVQRTAQRGLKHVETLHPGSRWPRVILSARDLFGLHGLVILFIRRSSDFSVQLGKSDVHGLNGLLAPLDRLEKVRQAIVSYPAALLLVVTLSNGRAGPSDS